MILLGLRAGASQSSVEYVSVTVECRQLHETAMAQATAGRLREAEMTVSAAVARGFDPGCAGLVLKNIAATTSLSGQLREAENLAEHAIGLLQQSETPQDRVVLRAWQILAATRIEQGKIARAREAYQQMRKVRIEKPEDAALVHGLAGSLFQIDGERREAEAEYFAAIRSWEAAGRGDTADAASVLSSLATLYVQERRLTDALRTVDRVQVILQHSEDTVPMDRLKLLSVRAAIRFLESDFQMAEQDAREALAIAEGEPQLSASYWAILLTDYARILRKNHRNQEARSMETRVSALRRETGIASVVDISELSRGRSSKR
jgi:tetratricopeptide (TPR) repeat protein